MNRKVYLAGPDVFDPHYERVFAERSRVCQDIGLVPLIPLDNRLTTSKDIFSFNTALIDEADGLIANISPFRGPHCDVGTAWEIAYAYAHTKPVFAFSNDTRLLEKRVQGAGASKRDANGWTIEPFGLAENLMIIESVFDRLVHPTFESAAQAAALHFGSMGHRPRRAQSLY